MQITRRTFPMLAPPRLPLAGALLLLLAVALGAVPCESAALRLRGSVACLDCDEEHDLSGTYGTLVVSLSVSPHFLSLTSRSCLLFVLGDRCGRSGEMRRRRRRRRGPPRGADRRSRQLRRGRASSSVSLGRAVRGQGPRRHGAALRAVGTHGRARRPGPGAWLRLLPRLLCSGLPPRLLHEVRCG